MTMGKAEAEELSFSEVLDALRDAQTAFPARYLYRLSGLEGEELEAVEAVWAQLAPQRRLGLLEDLELLAEANTVMNFDAIQRMALEDAEEDVRVVAIRSLWESEREELIPILLKLLSDDPSAGVRAQAAAGLGSFVYLGELGKIGRELLDKIVDELLGVLEEEAAESLIRRRALEALGYSGRDEAAKRIEKAYKYGDEDWQASALFAMGRSADERWTEQVMECLDDSNPELSKEAARAAGELELSEALPELLTLLDDELSEVRLAAAWSLSQIGGKGVAEALEAMQERAEDEDEIDLIENALDNLAFSKELEELHLLDFSKEDLEQMAKPEDEEGSPEEAD